jgi:hypothetical protein
MTAPVNGYAARSLHLQFVAADPLPVDPTWRNTTAWSGSGTSAGRSYPLTFPRAYPAGSGGPGATVGTIVTVGDVPVAPLLYIYGPITRPHAWIVNTDLSGTFDIYTLPGLTISAGHSLVIDTRAKTAYLDNDPTQPAMASIDWTSTSWPLVTPSPNTGNLRLAGSSTSGITQVVAWWQDVYLS